MSNIRDIWIDGPVAHSPCEDGQCSGMLVHCYGMVGVGRGNNPDTGTGVELYTVIGHAARARHRFGCDGGAARPGGRR